jgi:hypothetical protein
VHAVDTVEPIAVLYLPAGHTVHELCAVEAWYLPAAQVVHADATAAEYLRSDLSGKLGGNNEVRKQGPKCLRYLPAGHIVQALCAVED